MRASVFCARADPRASTLCARGEARASTLLAALWAVACVACQGPARAPTQEFPLNPADVPTLACSALPVGLGDCARRADCGSGELCTLDERVELHDRGPIPLRCGAPLGTGRARSPCSEGAECESGLCALNGVCLEPCGQSDDCPRGQSCLSVEARLSEDALAPVAACARVAAFPADVQVDAGQRVALRTGVVNRFTVQALRETSLVLLKADCARTLRVVRIQDRATQRLVFDVDALFAGVVQINPTVEQGALVPLLFPNNPRIPLSAQGFDIGVSVDADTELQVIRASRARRGRILDLNVFYVGGGTMLDASGLHPGSPEFAQVLGRLAERYAEIGLELGAVREFDVIGALRSELSQLVVDANVGGSGMVEQAVTDLDRLFALSAGLDQGGVNLFVIAKMGALLGISGGTPGSVGFHGSARSGVALALDTAGLERADQVLFHELGHQLGLFHTSEMDGLEIEPLSDTPACTAEQDSDGDGILHARECVDHGADNVMFWEGTGALLSPQQVEVLTRAPLLR
jgi:hypothetical protein